MHKKLYWSTVLNQEIVQTAVTVFEDDREPVFTGLLDQNGHAIMRDVPREPIGYLHGIRIRRKAGRCEIS